jgi:Spy/CpxP family protein refolding chaperone
LAFFALVISLIIAGPIGMTTPVSAAADDATDVIAMLTEELKLTPEQAQKLGPEINKFVTTLDQLKADQEKEGADPHDLVRGAKKAQEDYLKAVKKILTPEQFKQYNALKEKAVRNMFRDLAEIQLIDLQPMVGFSDEQLEQLVPVLGDALFQVITIAWEHAGKRLRLGQKIRLAKKLKHIQKDSRAAVSKILTPEQLKTWDNIKAKAQQQNK